MTDTAPAAPAADAATLLAQAAATNKALAQLRAPLLAAALTAIQASNSPAVAAALTAVRATQTDAKDLMQFKLHIDIHTTTESMLTAAIAANTALAAD